MNEEFYSSPRLDNLTSVEACLTGLLSAGRCGKDENTISLIALYDNEEVGSRTKQEPPPPPPTGSWKSCTCP